MEQKKQAEFIQEKIGQKIKVIEKITVFSNSLICNIDSPWTPKILINTRANKIPTAIILASNLQMITIEVLTFNLDILL